MHNRNRNLQLPLKAHVLKFRTAMNSLVHNPGDKLKCTQKARVRGVLCRPKFLLAPRGNRSQLIIGIFFLLFLNFGIINI